MTLQVRSRDSGDQRFTDPNRDLAHCFPGLLQSVAAQLDNKAWPPCRDYIAAHGIKDEELMAVCDVYCKLMVYGLEIPGESMDECLRRAGYFNLSQRAVFAYAALIGGAVIGAAFVGRRHAFLGEDTVDIQYSMASAGRRFLLLSKMSPWRRKLYFLWKDVSRSVRRWFSAMKGA